MTDVPTRILDDVSCDPSIRALVEEARSEPGSAAAKARTLAALGLAGAAVAGGAAVTVSAATGGAATGTSAASTGALSALTKILGGVLVAGAVGAGVTTALDRRPETPPVTMHGTRAPGAAALPSAPARATAIAAPAASIDVVSIDALPSAPEPATPEPEPSKSVRAAPRTLVRRAPDAVPTAGTSDPAPAASQLADEAAALEAARGELGRGQALAALAALDRFEQRFPDAELRPEATALRVEALAASGDRERARAVGQAFLVRHPGHPAAARVRRAIGVSIP